MRAISSDHDTTAGLDAVPQSGFRLLPLTAPRPITIASRQTGPVSADRVEPWRGDPAAIAVSVMTVCRQAMTGEQPLTKLRASASEHGYRRLSAAYRLARAACPAADRPQLRAIRASTPHGRALELVAMLRLGDRNRALAVQARMTAADRWQITDCQLV